MSRPYMQGVAPGWEYLMDLDLLDRLVAESGDAPTPEAGLAMEPFRYVRDADVKVVICGQDPYASGADGLAFSSERASPSLRNVLSCVRRTLGLPAPPRASEARGDLRGWAAQGVLLINAGLMRAEGEKSAACIKRWRPFVVGLLASLADVAGPVFFLWGKAAAAVGDEVAAAADAPPALLKWTHPSPTIDCTLAAAAKFAACDHFRAGPDICWDLSEPVTVYCDGSCPNNGAADAVASWGVHWVGGPLTGCAAAGLVAPATFGGAGEAAATPFTAGGPPVPPSNNRGELLAMCVGMWAALLAGGLGPVRVVSDSQIYVKLMNGGYEKKVRARKVSELKNTDLLAVAHGLAGVLEARVGAPVEFRHVRGHGKEPDPVLRAGNDFADALAVAISGGKGAEAARRRADVPAASAEAGLHSTLPWFIADRLRRWHAGG